MHLDNRQMMRNLIHPNNENIRKHIHIALRSLLSIAILITVLAVFDLTSFGQDSSKAASAKKILKVDRWRYYSGNVKPGEKWNHSGFRDRSWRRGRGKFGYGRADVETSLPTMRGRYKRLFVRSEFTANPRAVEKIDLSVVCDGPFVAYLNGIEVARSDKKWLEVINLIGFRHELLPGNNTLAVECTNNDVNSDSFLFVPSMTVEEK